MGAKYNGVYWDPPKGEKHEWWVAQGVGGRGKGAKKNPSDVVVGCVSVNVLLCMYVFVCGCVRGCACECVNACVHVHVCRGMLLEDAI
jgi:hypothetical protein